MTRISDASPSTSTTKGRSFNCMFAAQGFPNMSKVVSLAERVPAARNCSADTSAGSGRRDAIAPGRPCDSCNPVELTDGRVPFHVTSHSALRFDYVTKTTAMTIRAGTLQWERNGFNGFAIEDMTNVPSQNDGVPRNIRVDERRCVYIYVL